MENLDSQKRTFNTIWAAAEDYDFFPEFVGFDIAGNYDFYFNIVIGLACKYYGNENIKKLFDLWQNSYKRDSFDLMAWIGLESIVYEKEKHKRMALNDLRKSFAENFFLDKYDLKRRSLALKNHLVYSMQILKMKEILEMDLGNSGKRENELFKRLHFNSDISYENFEKSMLNILEDFFSFDPNKKPNQFLFNLSKKFSSLSFRPLERSINPASLFSDNNEKYSGFFKNSYMTFIARFQSQKESKIESVFGKSIYNEEKRIALLEKYCTGANKKSKLWYTRGEKDRFDESDNSLLLKNKAIFKKNKSIYNRQIHEISRRISSSLNSVNNSDFQVSKHGILNEKIAWKSKLPNYSNIFKIKTEEIYSNLTVDLLIDGSASLLNFQSDLAIEAYILAESLRICNIETRITAYTTVDDYTILTILKDFKDKPSQDKIFKYHAQAWNRDGLAYRAFNELLKDFGRNHLLIILSDASPSDIKPLYTKSFGLNHSYEGKLAVEDSRQALDIIRKEKISVSAIINTSENDDDQVLKNAKYLFKNNFVKTSSSLKFSDAASRLIRKEISKLSSN